MRFLSLRDFVARASEIAREDSLLSSLLFSLVLFYVQRDNKTNTTRVTL